MPEGYPGASIAILESVLNEGRLRAFDFAALRYYVAPLFVLEAAAPLHPITTPDGTLRYGFNLIAYTDRARTDAAQNLSQTITDPRNGQLVTIRPSSIYDLPHQLVQFRVIGLPEARVLSIGTDLDQNVAYNPVTRITVDIPPARQGFFESLVRSGNLQVEAVITYNARSVNRVQMQVSSASILTAARRRVFDGGGAAYFNADDLEQIVREAATVTDVNILIDPQADAEMVAWVRQFLDTLAAQNFATTAESLADARNLEARLWEGPGIQPADYQPITLLWNVTRDLATVDDYRMANDSVRQYYDENKTSFSASFKAGWGPFSATIRTGWERVTRSEEFFSNQEELQQFKRENLVEGGVEPRITARGLGLVSSRELETRATSLARVVAVKPTERISKVALQSLVVYDGSDSTDTLRMVDFRRRLAALEGREVKTSKISIAHDDHTDLAILHEAWTAPHAYRPISSPVPQKLADAGVTEIHTEVETDTETGRPIRRDVFLTIKWAKPFAEGATANAMCAFSGLHVEQDFRFFVYCDVVSVDRTGAVVRLRVRGQCVMFDATLSVIAFADSAGGSFGDLFPLDAAAVEIGRSAARQQIYGLYRPEVLAQDIRSRPTLQLQYDLHPLAGAASNLLASPALLESYGFKRRVTDLIRGSAAEMTAAGLYPESAIRNLHVGVPLVAVDHAAGTATVELGLEHSDTLAPDSWRPWGDTAVWTAPARPDQAFFRVFLNDRP